MFLPIRVLIIEDCDDDLILMLRELRRGGFEPEYIQVETAEAMANSLVEKEWDIILSDYALPNFSAPSALKVLKSTQLNIPFIVISGNVGEEIAVQLMQYGCNDYINKNNLTRLCPAIQRELDEYKTKRLHKASQELTERLWEILNTSQNEIYFFHASTLKFKIVSQGALKNLGFTLNEMLDKKVFDIEPKITEEMFNELITPLINKTENFIQFETVHERKNGTQYPVDVRLQLTTSHEESIFYAIVTDATNRLNAIKEIESLAKFPRENPSPVLRINADLSILYANPASETIVSEWTENNIINIPAHWKPIINNCITTNTVHDLEENTSDSIYHWLLSSTGDNTYVNCYARDITQERKAEQGLRQAGQVFDNCIEAIMITDENNIITRVNPAFHFITGYSNEDILGNTPEFFASGKHDETFFKDMWTSLKKNHRWQGEIWNRRKNKELFPAYLTISVVTNEKKLVTDYISIFSDISERKRAQEHIHHLAYYDALTNLPNRLHMQEKLHELIDDAETCKRQISVLYLDLDRFKTINESLGHRIADEALKITANRIYKCLPESAVIGRMGGDEFLIIIDDVKIITEQDDIIQIIKYAISQELDLNNQQIYLSATIGISHYPDDTTTMDNLVKYSERAVNQGKFIGNTFQLFSDNVKLHDVNLLSLESNLRKAMERKEFVLYYQPQIDLKTEEVIGLEALIRWVSPEKGLISPANFIPLLEQTGLIKEVGDWVLQEACTQSMSWQKLGITVPRIAINLSAKQFSQKNLAEKIKNIIDTSGVDRKLIELEVTESTIMHQMDQVIAILKDLHNSGLHIAIDDFGTGYSSLSYLKHFPIDVLKIDQSFVREIPKESDDIAIVNTIISMAHNLNLNVIAEGVETIEQAKCLLDMGCEWAQGYYYSKPLPEEKCREYLQSHIVNNNYEP